MVRCSYCVATVVALLVLGTVFLTQFQRGTDELAVKIQRTVGISLLVSGINPVGTTFLSQWYKRLTALAGIILLFSAALLIFS